MSGIKFPRDLISCSFYKRQKSLSSSKCRARSGRHNERPLLKYKDRANLFLKGKSVIRVYKSPIGSNTTKTKLGNKSRNNIQAEDPISSPKYSCALSSDLLSNYEQELLFKYKSMMNTTELGRWGRASSQSKHKMQKRRKCYLNGRILKERKDINIILKPKDNVYQRIYHSTISKIMLYSRDNYSLNTGLI